MTKSSRGNRDPHMWGLFPLFSVACGTRSGVGRPFGWRRSRHPGDTLCLVMAAGSSLCKIEGRGGVLPIVTVVCVIRGYQFRTKKEGWGAGCTGTGYRSLGRSNRSFSILTPDICFCHGRLLARANHTNHPIDDDGDVSFLVDGTRTQQSTRRISL
jgi:hypothetical protein